MRTPWLALLFLACGGNFSNDDLEFLNALPVREELSARLPGGATATSVGRLAALRVNGLALGAPSELYQRTHEASGSFNDGLDHLLSLLEGIRTLPPTTRAPDQRIWGPAPLDKAANHELRFTMTRAADVFEYVLQVRRTGSGEAGWWSLLTGAFQADGGLRRGTGELHLLTGVAISRGFDVGDLAGHQRLDIAYQTRAPPLRVEMNFASARGGPDVYYTYRELPGGLGEMTYRVQGIDVLGSVRKEDLSILSRWTRDGSGVARVKVTGGDVPAGATATEQECWDAGFLVTYRQRTWEGAEGSPAACPDVSALGPLP